MTKKPTIRMFIQQSLALTVLGASTLVPQGLVAREEVLEAVPHGVEAYI